MSIAHAQWQPTCFFMIQYGGFLSEKKVSLHFSLFTVITSSPYTRIDSPASLTATDRMPVNPAIQCVGGSLLVSNTFRLIAVCVY